MKLENSRLVVDIVRKIRQAGNNPELHAALMFFFGYTRTKAASPEEYAEQLRQAGVSQEELNHLATIAETCSLHENDSFHAISASLQRARSQAEFDQLAAQYTTDS